LPLPATSPDLEKIGYFPIFASHRVTPVKMNIRNSKEFDI